MAKNDANHSAAEPARVHKAADVHKRRVQGRSPAATDSAPEQQVSPVDQAASEGAASEAAMPENAAATASGGFLSSRRARDKALDDGSTASDDTGAAQPASAASSEGGSSSEDAAADGSSSAPAPDGDKPAGASADGTVDETQEEEASEKPRKPLWQRIVVIVLGVIAAALLVCAGYVFASRWLIFNDDADLQGRWYVYGTNVPISFADGSIAINSETSYSYHIDPTAKTIEYSFGNLEGQGRYWFNDARNTLVITDGKDYTMWSTLADDLSYGLRSMFGESGLPTTDSSIVLSRTVVTAPESAAGVDGAQGSLESGSGGQSESTSSAGADDGSTSAKSSEMLMVSDIMVDEEKIDSEY